jgi:hypothetical protein
LLIAWLAVFLDGRLDWVEYGSERNGVGVDGDFGCLDAVSREARG